MTTTLLSPAERFDLIAGNVASTAKLLSNLSDELKYVAKSSQCVEDMIEENLPEEVAFAKDTLNDWTTKPVVKVGPDATMTIEAALAAAISTLTFELDRLKAAKAAAKAQIDA